MTAEEVMRIVRDMPEEERKKVFYGLMKDFDQEMIKNPEFKHHAIDAMHRLFENMKKSGEDVSKFATILK